MIFRQEYESLPRWLVGRLVDGLGRDEAVAPYLQWGIAFGYGGIQAITDVWAEGHSSFKEARHRAMGRLDGHRGDSPRTVEQRVEPGYKYIYEVLFTLEAGPPSYRS